MFCLEIAIRPLAYELVRIQISLFFNAHFCLHHQCSVDVRIAAHLEISFVIYFLYLFSVTRAIFAY